MAVGEMEEREVWSFDPVAGHRSPSDLVKLLSTIVFSYSQMFRLSPQERRLLACAVRGVPDKCAADELGCTRNTVGTYWKRIYAKTGKRSQKDVLAHLLRVLACGSHAKSP